MGESGSEMVTKLPQSEYSVRFYQLMAGGGAGAITKTATAPLERIKILLQVQAMKPSVQMKDAKVFKQGKGNLLKYRGVVGTFTTIVREEGMLSLYKGNGANVLRVVPVYALKFTFNDFFRDICKKNRDDPDEVLNFSQLILSGTLAGLFQTSVTYPLETVRTRLTLGSGLGVHYKGILDVFQTTVRTEGIAGLYKGIGPTFITGSPYVGLQMTFFELIKRNQHLVDDFLKIKHIESNENVVHFYNNLYKLGCGAVAGILAQTITYPGDTIRRRMQTNGMNGEAKVYKNSWDCLRRIVTQEGMRKLYSGLSANVIRAVPGAAIQFWAYDTLKQTFGI